MIALAYHRIADDSRDPFAVRPRDFAAQTGWLRRLGFRGATLCAAVTQRGPRALALTFDDGTTDFAETAWPCLRRLGHAATLFVVPGRAGGRADWEPGTGTALLDWPALRDLRAAGVEIGAHGHTHARLDPDDEDAAHAEWFAAREALAAGLGTAPRALAYPYGEWSPALERAAARAGFALACTARGGRNGATTPLLKLRRTLVRRRDGLARFTCKVLTGYASVVDARMDLRGEP